MTSEPSLLAASCRRLGRLTVLLCLLSCGRGLPVQATTLLRAQGLTSLVGESRRALRAEVIGVRYGRDEHDLPSTFLRLRVDEPLYGASLPAAGGEITIKIFGTPLAMPDGSRVFVEGTPLYRVGERYLLLLIEESAWGFTNTAGLYQGALRVDDVDYDTLRGRVLSHWKDHGRRSWAEDHPQQAGRASLERLP